MSAAAGTGRRPTHRWRAIATVAVAAGLVLAACGGSSGNKTATSAPAKTTTSAPAGSTPSASSSPGTTFSVANVSGVGKVLVDGRGRTVYLLTSDGHTNVPCEDSTGCTKVWPDLALPTGTSAATAGAGLQASLLGTMKLSSGETYPTYGGWLMYEFAGDSGPAQGHGQGIKSFGGTWYAITPAGSAATSG